MIREATRLKSLDVDRVMLVASRHPATAAVANRLAERLQPGTRVLVATSGGPDSMALTAILLALHRRRDPAVVEPVVGHVDHAIRSSSDAEARFVTTVAGRLGLEAITRRLDWPADATGVTSERARDARWAALDAMAAEVEAAAILTGHHADDQAETVLMRLARGTGLAGLTGIPVARSTPGGRLVLRPLLRQGRTELAALVDAAGLPWIEDPTNHDRTRTRERLRHEVMPALEAIHPRAARHLAALAEECAATPPIITSEPDTIIRSDMRHRSEAAVATQLRALAARLTDRSVRSVPRDVWRRAAVMVRDGEPRPRRLRIDAGLELVVHRDRAVFEVADRGLGGVEPSDLPSAPPVPSSPDDDHPMPSSP